jgi:hypothetical protein
MVCGESFTVERLLLERVNDRSSVGPDASVDLIR